jgi:hypothetical protein
VTTVELDDWLNPKSYLGTAVAQVDRAVATLRKRL